MDKMMYIYIACGVLVLFLVFLLIVNSITKRKKKAKTEVKESSVESIPDGFEVVTSTEYVMPQEEKTAEASEVVAPVEQPVVDPVVIPEIFVAPVIPEESSSTSDIPDIPAPLSSSDGLAGEPVYDPMYDNKTVSQDNASTPTQYNSFNDVAAAFMTESTNTNKDQSN